MPAKTKPTDPAETTPNTRDGDSPPIAKKTRSSARKMSTESDVVAESSSKTRRTSPRKLSTDSTGSKSHRTKRKDSSSETPLVDQAKELAEDSATSLAIPTVTVGPSKSKKKQQRNETSKTEEESPKDPSANTPPSSSKKLNKKKHKKKKKRSRSESKSRKEVPDPSTPDAPLTKPPPTMDVIVHRIRHLDYHPKPILCLQATTPHNNDDCWLAISRDNGSIELKSFHQKLKTIATVAGWREKKVNVLAWTCGTSKHSLPTLVGGSSDGTLFIIDFSTGQLVGMMPSGGGGVFCLTSLCTQTCPSGHCAQLVAAGCEDGAVRIYRVLAHERTLELVSTISSAGSAVLSLAWTRYDADRNDSVSTCSNGCAGSVLYAGVADGTIRRYDCHGAKATSTGNDTLALSWKSTLRMTVESYGRNIPTRVWTLAALIDGTVVSGDSLGHVQFWDGHSGTLQQSFDQNDNKADVLDLDVTGDECKVFASGVDSRVVCIERPSLATGAATPLEPRSVKWIMTHAQRPHTHDVRSVAICRERLPSMSSSDVTAYREILCTGGIDTKLCTYQVKGFQKKRPRTLYPWPYLSPVSIATKARILMMRREDCIDLYQLGPKQPRSLTSPVVVPDEETLIGTVEVQSVFNLVCAAISDDGHFLALSDTSTLLLFALTFKDDGSGSRSLHPSRVPLTLPATSSIVTMKFLNNERLVLAASNGAIHTVALSADVDDESSSEMDTDDGIKATLEQIIESSESAAKEERSLPADSIYSTDDGSWFAIVSSRKVQVFREDDGGLYRHWWDLPTFEKPHSALSFLSSPTPQLAVACLDFSVYVFDLERRRLSTWSEEAGYPVSKSLPTELNHRNDYPVRLAVDPASPSKLLMGSFGAFVVIDTEEKFPKQCRIFPETHVRGKKRRRALSVMEQSAVDKQSGKDEPGTCTLCLRYNSMLFLNFVGDHEMVVVEQPWLSVVATLPDALSRRVYGS